MLEIFRSRPFVLCFLANLAQMTSFYLFLHFPGHLKALGAGEQTIGWLVALTEFASIAIAPFVGRWLDQRGRRQVLVIGSLLNVILCAGFLVASSLLSVFALRILHGAIETVLNVAFFTYASDVIPERNRSQGFALFGISAMGAVGLGAAVGNGAIELGGYQGIFLTSMVLSIVGMLMVFWLDGKKPAGAEEDGSSAQGWLQTLIRPSLVGVWLLAGAFFFSMISVFVFLKTWVGITGIGSIGLFFTVYTVTAIVLRLFAGGLPDRLGHQRVAIASLLAYAAGLLLVSVTSAVPLFVLAALVCGVGHGFGYPVLLALVTERANDADRGSAISIFNALDDGAALLAAPALGFAIEAGSYPVMFMAAALVIVLGVVFGGGLLAGRPGVRNRE